MAVPYTNKQVQSFRDWALGQASVEKRKRAMLMLVYCAGAGFKSSDVAQVFPHDIKADDDGIIITVRGQNPRRVPLLREWEDWMLAIIDQAEPDMPLWGTPNKSTASTVLSKFVQYTSGAKPNAQRLRASWIVTQLQAGTRVKDLMKAMGQTKFESMQYYLEYVTELDDAHYRRQLREADNQW